MDDKGLLKRLERSLKAVGGQSRDKVRVRGFEVFIDPSSDAYHLSFAVPSDIKGDNWAEAIKEMQNVFTERSRRARLEYFHELHPDLAGALENEGFHQDMRAPVMTLQRQDLSEGTRSSATYLALTMDHSDRLEGYLRRQSLAYGGNGDDGALVWLDSMRKGLAAGDLMVAGLEQESAFVSGASIQIGGNVGELAGVWTLPQKQRRGLAYALCQTLLSDYFENGYDLCWLSAAEGALGLYERLGFRKAGTQLNYGFPEKAERSV